MGQFMACSICLDKRKDDVFKTGRVAICRSCIQFLNETYISLARASEVIDAYLRRRLHAWDDLKRTRPEAYEPWLVKYAIQRHEDPVAFESYFMENRAKWVNQLAGGGYKEWLSAEQVVALKVIRAFRRHLLRKDPRRNFDYPADWKIRSAKVRRQDKEACRLCGKTWNPGVLDIHVHHIVHKSNGGGHNPNNLVTLCHQHHNDEHPDQVFTAGAVKPESLCPVAPRLSLQPESFRSKDLEGNEVKNYGSRAPAAHEVSISSRVSPESDDDLLADGVTIAGAYVEQGASPVKPNQADDTLTASQWQDHRRYKKVWHPLLFLVLCMAFLLLIYLL